MSQIGHVGLDSGLTIMWCCDIRKSKPRTQERVPVENENLTCAVERGVKVDVVELSQ